MTHDKRVVIPWLQERVAALLGEAPDSIAVDRTFADYGLSSAEGVAMIVALGQLIGATLSPALLWDCPDIASLAAQVCGEDVVAAIETPDELDARAPIAIVGMACRYPGAPDLGKFWQLLELGEVSIGPIPEARWDAASLYHPDREAPGRSIGRVGGFLSRVEEFDAHFFGISPREAAHVDPRQRLMLELAWEAFEDAGVPLDEHSTPRTGVFVAVLNDDYNLLFSKDLSLYQAATGAGTANSLVANRVSYAFDLRGPSLTLDTACSGSLVALTLACRSLRAGECSLALAAGVNVNLLPHGDVFFTKAGALSPTGRCRSFDAAADGIVRSEGAGVVLLKPLARAIADGDRIYAVIRGEALNHDGRTNGVMAPSRAAQEALLAQACKNAGVHPGDVQWVEAHGTGTPLGDPIEVNAMITALGRGRRADQPLVVGSVKANIGHTEAAAGIAGVIKVALSLRAGRIPPQPAFHTLNPAIDRPAFPLLVPTNTMPWPGAGPRIAGVSGFGFGGANAHVVLEQAPMEVPRQRNADDGAPRLLPISARSPEAFVAMARSIAEVLESAPLADICYTAACRRTHNKIRAAVVVGDVESTRAALERLEPPAPVGREPRVAFVYSGQGTHWPGMARECLADQDFLAAIEPAAALFELHGTPPLLPLLREADSLERTAVAQPLVFLVQLGLTRLWRRAGVEPVAVLGQSLGEIAAAHVSGALSLEDAVSVVFHRSRLMQGVAGRGATAVIGLPREQVELSLAMAEALDVAGVTATETTLVSGPRDEVDRLVAAVTKRGVFARVLAGVDVAFHGRQMEPLLSPLTGSLAGVMPTGARIPMVSTLSGEWIHGPELDGRYWAKQLLRPFDLPAALARVDADVFVELGPHAALQGALTSLGLRAVPSMRRGEAVLPVTLASLAELHALGVELDWRVLTPPGRLVSFPNYPWQRERHWIDQLRRAAPEGAGPRGRVRSAAGDGQLFEQLELSLHDPPWLIDHQVHGSVAMPGAAWATLAASAGRELLGGAVEVGELRFHRLLRIPAEGAVMQLVLTPEGPDSATFVAADARRERLASGLVRQRQGQGMSVVRDLDALRRSCPRREDPEHLDALLVEQGFRYGPSFRAIERLHVGEGQALARLRLPTGLEATGSVHPVLLDAAFRVIASVAVDETLRAPAGLRRAWLGEQVPGEVWCHVRCSGSTERDSMFVDIELLDDDGRVLVSVEGFELAAIEALPEPSTLLYQLEWEPVGLEARDASDSWALVNVPDALRQALERRGHTTSAFETGVEARRILWAVDPDASAQAQTETFLHLATRLGSARLSILTAGAQAVRPNEGCSPDQAAVWGFARVFANEHPERWGGIVDALGVSDDAIAAALTSEGEDQLALRDDGAHALRLRPAQLGRTEQPRVLRRNASYLITGGLSGLGAETARWMVQHGCRRLILAARSSLPPREEWARLAPDHPAHERVALVRELEALGCAVHPAVLDVADPEQLRALLARHEAEGLPPIRGVVHSAGSLHDELIWRMTVEDLRTVLAPKVDGARALDQLTGELDFFVLYSSISSILGRTGQANYAAANAFLDALALERRARGRPATVINWGPWRDTGMFAGLHDDRGPVRSLSRELGRETLTAIWNGKAVQCAVVDADWTRIPRSRLLVDLQPDASGKPETHDPNKLLALLLLEPEQRLNSVETELRALAAEVLRAQPSRVDVYATLFELGMDSLMVIELKRRAEATYGQELTMNDVFSGSIIQLANTICVKLEHSEQLEALLSHIEALPMSEVEALLEGHGR
jgi:acyl transferase domain-containing protein/acyl carrier protein